MNDTAAGHTSTSGSLRSRLGRLVGGGATAPAALAEHQAAIAQLQRDVAELRTLIDRSAGEQRQAVRAAVDDLGARVGALADRIDHLEQ